MDDLRRLVRIAGNVHHALSGLKHGRYLEHMRQFKNLSGKLQEFAAESKKMGIALTHNWLSAADRCRTNMDRLLIEISYSISQVQQLTQAPQKKIPQLPTIIDDLNELQREFESLNFDKAKNSISVVTEPITLEDIHLGPFQILLELNKFSDLYKIIPYRVIALDPNPAATNDTVTHPHVSGEKLCEGDGSAAIRASLEQGRLSDFFTLVRNILNTYNPDGPHVALHDWDGTVCYECGYTVNSEDSYYCYYCEHDFCQDCSTFCRHCNEMVCLSCSEQCAYCEEFACRNCRGGCEKCGELFCLSCLEDDICPNCMQEMENEDEQQKEDIKQCENTKRPQAKTTEAGLAG